MGADDFDPRQFKDAQRQQWNAAAAGWRKWWEFIERTAGDLSARMLDLAQVRPGHRVLDVATGIGEPALSAARRVGSDGSVVATDQAPQMLEIGRERAQAEGLSNVEFLEFDGEALDVAPGEFDAALCRWGLMFLPDAGRAVSGMRDALRPGGGVAVATWSVPKKTPFLSLPMGVLRRELDLPPPPADAPGLFSLADVEILAELLASNGFSDVSTETRTLTFEYDTVDVYIDSLKDLAAPIVALVDGQPPPRRAKLWAKIGEAANAYANEDGVVRLTGDALVASGRRA